VIFDNGEDVVRQSALLQETGNGKFNIYIYIYIYIRARPIAIVRLLLLPVYIGCRILQRLVKSDPLTVLSFLPTANSA